jgi:hypothetical protein
MSPPLVVGKKPVAGEIVGIWNIRKYDRRIQMKLIANVVLANTSHRAACGARDIVSAVHGTIDKIDSGTKVVVVKTADGTRRSLHRLDRTAVHGADFSACVQVEE